MKMMKNSSMETDKSDKSPQIMKKNNEHFISYSVGEKYPCNCNLCILSQKKKIPKPMEEIQLIKSKSNSCDRDFIFIVTRLVQESFGRTLNIQIQDTVYFEKGEPQSILQSIKDGIDRPFQLRIQQWKGSLQKLMQYLNNRRKKITNNNIQLDLIQICEKQQSTLSNVNKEQINNNISEKSKEAVLVKFEDDSVQIMTESEFVLLMSKRKGDKFWQRIFYIQNYIKQRAFLTHRIHFNRKSDINHILFDRSAMETRIIRGEVISASQEYITQTTEEEFLRQLKEKSIFEYLKYNTFKIIQFLDILDDTIINEGIFEWNQDDRGEFQLFNSYQLTYQKRTREDRYISSKPQNSKNNNGRDSESVEEEREIDPKKMFNRKYQLQQIAKKAQITLKLKQQHLLYKDTPKVSQWQFQMKDDYHALLQSIGIDINQFNLNEDNQSELTFKYLHPELQIEFQKIMKDQSLFNKLKKQLFIQNSKFQPISQSKMLNSFFLTSEKKQRSKTVSKQPRQDLISTLNQSFIKKTIRSVDRTVSEFRYEISRNAKRSAKSLNKILGLANS